MSVLVAVVRQNENDEIVDALIAKQVDGRVENLSARLLEKWPPFTHDIEAILTDNLSNYFSTDEVLKIERFAQANASGRPLIEPSATRIRCDLSDPNSVEYMKGILTKCLRTHKGNVAIVTGEAHFKIYDQEICDIMTHYVSGSLNQLLFVCGPVVVMDNKFRRNRIDGSIVPLLGKLENVDLRYSDVRQEVHFRLGGTDDLYVEDPHIAASQVRFGWLFENDIRIGLRFRNTVEHVIKSQDVRVSKNPADDFLLLTSSELSRLKNACQVELLKSKKTYNDCTKHDLMRIIKKHNILEN